MANDYSSMFGFQTPEQIRSDALSSLITPRSSMAGQGLLQQGVSMMSNAGANIGMSVAEAMGRQLPAQVKQDKIKQILQQVSNIASPLGQAQAAYQLFQSEGMVEEAQKAMGTIRKLQEENLSYDERVAKMEAARIKAEKPSPQKEFIQITDFLSSLDAAIANNQQPSVADLNKARLYLGKLSKSPKIYTDRETLQQITIPGYDAAQSVPALSALLNNQPLPQAGAATTQQSAQGAGANTGAQQPNLVVTDTPGSVKLQQKEIESLGTAIDRMEQAIKVTQATSDVYNKGFQTSPGGYGFIKNAVPDALGGFLPEFQELETNINTLKSMKVIDTIQMMKAQSATGATGFGALNATELQRLEDDYNALNPMAEGFKESLASWQANLERALKKLRAKMQEATGGKAAMPEAPVSNDKPKADRAMWMALMRQKYPNKSEAELEAALRKSGKI